MDWFVIDVSILDVTCYIVVSAHTLHRSDVLFKSWGVIIIVKSTNPVGKVLLDLNFLFMLVKIFFAICFLGINVYSLAQITVVILCTLHSNHSNSNDYD